MTDFLATDWGNALIDECRAILTEHGFTARWSLVEGWHKVGERICTEQNLTRKEIYGQKISQRIAESLKVSERAIQYAIKFYEAFPDLNMLREGKNITWSGIIQKYLTDGEREEPHLTLGRLLNCPLDDLDARLQHDINSWRIQGKTLLAAVESVRK